MVMACLFHLLDILGFSGYDCCIPNPSKPATLLPQKGHPLNDPWEDLVADQVEQISLVVPLAMRERIAQDASWCDVDSLSAKTFAECFGDTAVSDVDHVADKL